MPDPNRTQPLMLRCTLYYTALETDYAAGTEAAFRTRTGELLHPASTEFVQKAGIEGSAKLADGRTLNVDGRVGGENRWRVVTHAYGLDAIGCPLVMLRSVAVDRKVVPLRSTLRIAETVGLLLPDGSRHDGVWFAADVGGAIRGDRIDLFVGAGRAAMNVVAGHGIRHLQALTVHIGDRFEGCP